MELSLWSKAGIDPAGQSWYVETGQGMGATLTIASETDAYTLTDRATYLANQDTLSLEILVESDASLLNAYHVIVVNPDLWPEINNAGAIAFADFITSDKGQDLIADFGVEEFSQPLFIPDADKTDADLGLP
jgi:tungstate transport system substrate-binding protein